MTPLSDLLLFILPTDSIPVHLKSHIPGVSPFSTWSTVSIVIASYVVSILVVREFMKHLPSFKLQMLFKFHNALLSIASLALLLLITEEAVSLWMNVGTFNSMCAPSSWTYKLEFYYIVNYYFKYYEFLDTLFLVLRKKPLSASSNILCKQLWIMSAAFLHVFHHASAASLPFVQLNGKIIPSWIIVSTNLLVHVVMYYYYYATAEGAKLWWKKYLTTMQIIQFIIDLFIFCFTMYQHYAYTYFPEFPHFGDCPGSESAALFCGAFILSYLLLFADFYIRTYNKKSPFKAKTT